MGFSIEAKWVRRTRTRWQAAYKITDNDTGVTHTVYRLTDVACGSEPESGRGRAIHASEAMRGKVLGDWVRAHADGAVSEHGCPPEADPVPGTATGGPDRSKGGEQELASLISSYLRSRCISGEIERKTYDSYAHSLDVLAPLIGDKAPSEITARDLQAWIDGSIGSGALTRRTVSDAVKLLNLFYRSYSMTMGDAAPANPCQGVRRPRAKAMPKKNPLSPTSIVKVNSLLKTMPDGRVKRAAMIALHTGLRVGEVCALRWRDVDLEGGSISVSGSICTIKGSVIQKDTKGHRSRTIPLDSVLKSYLAGIRAGIASSPSVDEADASFVIAEPGEQAVRPDYVSKTFARVMRAAGIKGQDGLPLRFHGLRHTFATQWIASGGDVRALSDILGHADVSTTLNIYCSVDRESQRRGMESTCSVVSRGLPQSVLIEPVDKPEPWRSCVVDLAPEIDGLVSALAARRDEALDAYLSKIVAAMGPREVGYLDHLVYEESGGAHAR